MIKQQLQQLQQKVINYQITSPEQLQAFKNNFISKKSPLHTLFAQLKALSPHQKKTIGPLLNQLKGQIQQKYKQHQQNLHTSSTFTLPQDITLPPPPSHPGALHPLNQLTQKIIRIFQRIGFSIAQGPEIESTKNNFTLLNFQPNHPAINMQDTFYIKKTTKHKQLLRTHTSSVQSHILQHTPPPIRVLSTGKVFRKETISARTHCIFHQLEALYINKNVTFLHLKAAIFFLYTTSLAQKPKHAYVPPTFPSQSLA